MVKQNFQFFLNLPASIRPYVASKRLSSDAGNLISPLRNCLNPKLVQNVFLKRNMKIMEVFASDWDDLKGEELE